MTEPQTPVPAVAETAHDSKTFKKLLMDQVRSRGGTQVIDTKQLFQSMVKDTLEAFLELEMEEHLGYARNAPEGRGSGNARNGSTGKTVRGDFGEVEIETPRDRNASFDPKIVAKRQTSVGNFSEAVISLYARGLSTREIEQHVRDIYGVEISPQFVSRLTEELQQQITEWQSRPLERVYPIIFVDGLRVAVRTDKGVLKKCVYTVLGVGISGRQEVLGLWIEETEGARFWLKVFNDLKARGVSDALIVCGDGLNGLRQAVEAVFPQADVQLCVVHHIRSVTKFVSWKDRKALCADMRPIYTAPTVEAAELALQRFAENWQSRYPMSVASWRNHWPELTTFFRYPVELRRIIYTTNAIESLHSQMRKNISSRKVFPHDEAVVKILFLNIRNFSNRWNKRHGWNIVMNQLMQMFGERLQLASVDSL
ncbi:MAG TPA: IS256 family transposase [Bryobacteraceae bacterium]|jgi:transposase-like protein|nr:IS256 family transposase [Bryobacteraceae bacterium]